MIYQLRLPTSLGLTGLYQHLMKELEASLGVRLKPDLSAKVSRFLEKHLERFDTCGHAKVCDEQAVPAVWNRKPLPLLLNPKDHDLVIRLHLRLPGGSLQRLSKSVGRYLHQRVDKKNDKMRMARRKKTSGVLYDGLAPYIFVNPLCRKTEHCKPAQRIALPPLVDDKKR